MNRQIGMITFIGKEGRDASRSTGRGVVSKFCPGAERVPSVLLIVAEDTKVLLKSLISALGLAVTFGMVSGSIVKRHIWGFSKGSEEAGHELGSAVRGNVFRYTVFGEDMKDE